MKKLKYFLTTKTIGLYINLLSFLSPRKATQLAYSLFSEPRRGKLDKKNLPSILQEAVAESFQINDSIIQTYIWKGNENVVLLVHGWESNASRWENTIPYLKKNGATIIAIDAPAHGLSDGKEFTIPKYGEFINFVAQKFNVNYIIGHSLGGKASLYYQSHYQNKNINKIVILGSPSDFDIIMQNYIDLLSLNSKVSKNIEKYYWDNFKFRLEDFAGKLFASKIQTSGLIAHDIDDTTVLFEEAKKIQQHWKNAAFITTNGLGHSMHDDKLYKEIVAFLFKNETV